MLISGCSSVPAWMDKYTIKLVNGTARSDQGFSKDTVGLLDWMMIE
jgi:hypothetical protein